MSYKSAGMSVKVAVVGAGSWGTALANVFADQGCETIIWARDPNVASAIQQRHHNPNYLKNVSLNHRLQSSDNLRETLSHAEIIICAIPTQQIRAAFSRYSDVLQSKTVVNTSKGIEMGTHLRVSEIFHQLCPQAQYAVISGPSFAEEVVQRLPAAVTVAAKNIDVAGMIQSLISNQYFRAYTSNDIVGVELAGALKNVIAVATGLVAGLKLGYNAQAAIINRGIAEIMRMGKHFGAQPLTFLGLAGTGDLVLTCTGPLSRNRNLGIQLGEGKKLIDIQRELGGVAEGVFTAQSAHELASRHQIDMPITEQVYNILYKGTTAHQALAQLMSRHLKEEWPTETK